MAFSLSEIRNRLGFGLVSRLEKMFQPTVLEKILRGFEAEKMPVVRVNTLKSDLQNIMSQLRSLGVRFQRVDFLKNALIIQNKSEKFFEDLEIYKNGEIYFQGISSQLPVLFLDPKPGETVLDLCAAPGSKTTQIAMAMQNQGKIVANEIDQIRFERLKYNLQKQGVKIAETICGNALSIAEKFPTYFDKILADVPCSAEGRINIGDPRSYRFWSEKVVNSNAKLQKKILSEAVEALKPGGTIIYSTCTLAPEENEMVVEWFLNEYGKQFRLEKIELEFQYKLPISGSFGACLKAMPSNISEGFFVAKFKNLEMA